MKDFAKTFLSLLLLSLGLQSNAQTSEDYLQYVIETTEGNFTVELFAGRAPLTVANFIQYVDEGFYEGVTFHRVVGGFVVQTGGYDENYKKKTTRNSIPNESGNGLSNRRGYLAMARTADPHSADSQFFINLADNLPLDPSLRRWGYTVFGRVIDGMDVVDQIGYTATGPGPAAELTQDVPAEPILINGIRLASVDVPGVAEPEE
ncbi:MAG: peptidylprolyl isomerase [Gammaproteobacteria bacterium]